MLKESLQEPLFDQTSIIVLVHPVEDILGSLLGSVRRLHGPGAQHVIDRLHFVTFQTDVATVFPFQRIYSEIVCNVGQ